MDFGLSEELVMLRDMVRSFAAGKIAPFADEWDANHYFPYEEVVKPITDPSHPNYSLQIWNHFHAEAYDYAANRILEWYTQKSLSRFLRNSLPDVFFSRR